MPCVSTVRAAVSGVFRGLVTAASLMVALASTDFMSATLLLGGGMIIAAASCVIAAGEYASSASMKTDDDGAQKHHGGAALDAGASALAFMAGGALPLLACSVARQATATARLVAVCATSGTALAAFGLASAYFTTRGNYVSSLLRALACGFAAISVNVFVHLIAKGMAG